MLIFVLLAGVFAAALMIRSDPPKPSDQPSTTLSSDSSPAKTHSQTNEIIDPYEISKNPYKLKGRSGILNTAYVTLLSSTGENLPVPYPGGCLRFEKMLDEHTAVYSVLVARQDVYPDGEIALILDDSNPPNFTLPWRVTVIGPIEGTNAFGGRLTVAAVKFDGYASLPPQKAAVAPPVSRESIREPTAQNVQPSAEQSQPPAVDPSSGADTSKPEMKIKDTDDHPINEPN